MSTWFTTLGSRRVYDGRVRVRVDELAFPDGGTAEREIVEALDAAAVVAIDTREQVLLVKQYRQATGGYLLEIPAGVLDVEGEDPAATAARELIEETHHEAERLSPLSSVWNSAGWTTERTHLFLATGCRAVGPPDDFEPSAEEADMEVIALPFAQAIAAVHAGDITDAKSVMGLLLAADRHR